jgi:hypothetical protein
VRADAALGVRYEGDALPLLVPGDSDGAPSVQVTVTRAEEIEDRWADARDPRLLFVNYLPDRRPFLTVERDDALGYRIWAHEHGVHLVPPDGGTLLSALPDDPDRYGFRLLAGQVYPLIAALHSREVLHAGAVEVGGRLVGFAARSGTGKSSTICQLVARGGRFFADDALALEPTDDGIRAHPGPRLLNVAFDQLETLSPEPLGRRLGQSDKAHFEPPGDAAPRSLDAVFFLERGAGGASLIEPVHDPARILANASLPYLDTPDRLRLQLDVVAALARVPLMRFQVGADDSAAAVAEQVKDWVETAA